MIIILGISRAGTSYLTEKINQFTPMWTEKNDHNEDRLVQYYSNYLLTNYDPDGLFLNKEVSKRDKNQFKNFLVGFKLQYPKVGFKNPRLMFFIDEIKEVYPEAKLLILERDYYSWRESHRNKGRTGKEWEKKLFNHYNYMAKIAHKYKLFTINYEILDRDSTQKRLFNYLGFELDFSDLKIKKYL